RPGSKERHNYADAHCDEDGNGNAVRNEQAPLWHRNTAGIGEVLCNTHRPGIGIGDSHGCKRGTATDKGKGDLGPNGALWEIEALALPPSEIQSDDDCCTGNNGHHPAPERSDRPRWP